MNITPYRIFLRVNPVHLSSHTTMVYGSPNGSEDRILERRTWGSGIPPAVTLHEPIGASLIWAGALISLKDCERLRTTFSLKHELEGLFFGGVSGGRQSMHVLFAGTFFYSTRFIAFILLTIAILSIEGCHLLCRRALCRHCPHPHHFLKKKGAVSLKEK